MPKNCQPKRNAQVLRNVYPPKTKPGSNRKYEQTASKEIESVKKTNKQKKKKKTFSTDKSPGPHGVIGKFYYTILKS